MKLPFLKVARRTGARFSFGSNARGKEVGDITYGLEMAKELGPKRKDVFKPGPVRQEADSDSEALMTEAVMEEAASKVTRHPLGGGDECNRFLNRFSPVELVIW